ncbi:MAG: DUF6851 domain-containing protein [Pseudomonadota bacterium]
MANAIDYYSQIGGDTIPRMWLSDGTKRPGASFMSRTLSAVMVSAIVVTCGGGGPPPSTQTGPVASLRLEVNGGTGTGIFEAGDIVAVQAGGPEESYFFSHWSSDHGGVFADASSVDTTFTMPNAPFVQIRANYIPNVGPEEDVSAARRWSEVLLQSIRNDFARPTVHARNLFHVSAAMYDAWAAYSASAQPWLLGRTRADIDCELPTLPEVSNIEDAREQALSHAAYRLIRHRFVESPGAEQIVADAEAMISFLGFDRNETTTDLSTGPAALGNHIAQCYIDLGLVDGANEANGYINRHYIPVNERLRPEFAGNPDITNMDRWQPLLLIEFVDQAGNPTVQRDGMIAFGGPNQPEFLSAEWGSVIPFSLSDEDLTIYQRDDFDYWVYHDPGAPPLFNGELADNYKWTFSLVSIWSSHLDPDDGVMIDISPASLGNIESYPTAFEDYPTFYNTLDGGDPGTGYDVNPATGTPYEPQLVPRGDYTRVLAEFWADGPHSETPPGHWFVILNEVNDHPLLVKRFAGSGPVLTDLEWDIKAYFVLGGAMHDAAITAWGIKGWYDYIRPISSLRAMAALGQSSDDTAASFHEDGLPLTPGLIELVAAGDPLAGAGGEHVGKIKLLSWRGPEYVENPDVDDAGVGWVLAENWWPYQRPTFVTPPFAGYVSGHSTYSRAAAEVMTALTGDPFFPGGMSGFEIEQDEFLVFEDGPSVNMTLQWATYRDASDQCSLSRIWGGIHPPADDIPGRLIGIEVGQDAFAYATTFIDGTAP